uniref:Reverse transcriptase n=1 Tax=Haemonchus contortus TaxID=6289 RepID=A0A7I4YYA4_HAECO
MLIRQNLPVINFVSGEERRSSYDDRAHIQTERQTDRQTDEALYNDRKKSWNKAKLHLVVAKARRRIWKEEWLKTSKSNDYVQY